MLPLAVSGVLVLGAHPQPLGQPTRKAIRASTGELDIDLTQDVSTVLLFCFCVYGGGGCRHDDLGEFGGLMRSGRDGWTTSALDDPRTRSTQTTCSSRSWAV